MTVITNQYQPGGVHGATVCSACGEDLGFPYVRWLGHREINFCGKCCRNLKRGLVADLIQAAAIEDMQSLGYYNFTLLRGTIKTAEAQDQHACEMDVVPLRKPER